jgi:hypothetical protein
MPPITPVTDTAWEPTRRLWTRGQPRALVIWDTDPATGLPGFTDPAGAAVPSANVSSLQAQLGTDDQLSVFTALGAGAGPFGLTYDGTAKRWLGYCAYDASFDGLASVRCRVTGQLAGVTGTLVLADLVFRFVPAPGR